MNDLDFRKKIIPTKVSFGIRCEICKKQLGIVTIHPICHGLIKIQNFCKRHENERMLESYVFKKN